MASQARKAFSCVRESARRPNPAIGLGGRLQRSELGDRHCVSVLRRHRRGNARRRRGSSSSRSLPPGVDNGKACCPIPAVPARARRTLQILPPGQRRAFDRVSGCVGRSIAHESVPSRMSADRVCHNLVHGFGAGRTWFSSENPAPNSDADCRIYAAANPDATDLLADAHFHGNAGAWGQPLPGRL